MNLNKTKTFFYIFFYVSILFLIYTLYRNNYLEIPFIASKLSFIISILLLLSGFVFYSMAWEKVLIASGYKTDFKECIASVGLSIFGKYIPGKIWMIVGRAGYISQKNEYKLNKISAISLNAQFIGLWVGLFLGGLSFLFLGENNKIFLLLLFFWIFLTLIIFTRFFHNYFEILATKIFKKNINIPSLKIREVLKTLKWFLIYWILFSTAFYFFVNSLTGSSIPLYIGLIFPLANTLGIIAFFAPGGLGIREGVIATLLILSGIDKSVSVTIATFSRLWFLIGDIFIFSIGVVFNRVVLKRVK